MMTTRKYSALLVLLVTLFAAAPDAAAAKLKVAATVPDLAAIAYAVGQGRAEVFSLTLPTQDPHYVDARPHLVLKLSRADLLLLVGLQLEVGWLPTLLTGSRNPGIQKGSDGYLDCSAHVQIKEASRVKIDRSMGDIHPGGNPHYLVAPHNAMLLARAIASRMSRLDPGGKNHYWNNAKRFIAALTKAQRRWLARLAPYRGTRVVAYHRSWTYFVDAIGLQIATYLEPKPGIPPNAAHVLRVIRTIKAKRIPLLLQEEYYPDRTASLVAKKTGAQLVILDGGTHLRSGHTYLQRLERMVKKVEAALKRAKGKGK